MFNQDGSTLSPAAFTVTTSGKANCGTCGEIPDPVTPTVVLVGEDPDDPTNPTRVRVVLDGPIPVGVWTTVAVAVENACGVEATTFFIDVAHLPVDVNQSRVVNISDATAFATEFNAAEPNKKLVDTNRSGGVNITDATEFGNQWTGNGPLATVPWQAKELLSEPQHP